jgi:hypothetical protein
MALLAKGAASYGSLPMPLGRGGKRPSRLPAVVAGAAGLAMVALVAMSTHSTMSPGAMLSMPMATLMKDIHKDPSADLHGAGLPSGSSSSGAAIVSSLRQLDEPQVSVKDTTGRTLSDEAIQASGLSDEGKLSDNDLAVLEAAGSLTPQLAARRNRGMLPAYIQVAQDAAARDAEHSEYMDAIPGNIVTIREQGGVDPKVAAKKAKKELDRLNKGYAKSMQKWLTGSGQPHNLDCLRCSLVMHTDTSALCVRNGGSASRHALFAHSVSPGVLDE